MVPLLSRIEPTLAGRCTTDGVWQCDLMRPPTEAPSKSRLVRSSIFPCLRPRRPVIVGHSRTAANPHVGCSVSPFSLPPEKQAAAAHTPGAFEGGHPGP